MKLAVLILCWCICQVSLAQANHQPAMYAAYVPKTIKRGENFTFTLHILPSVNNTVRIGSKLATVDGRMSLKNHNILMQPGESSVISMDKVPVNPVTNSQYRLTITGLDHVTGEELFHNTTNNELKIENRNIESNQAILMIETDKSVYKRGQTIQFRILCLSPQHLLPLNSSLMYQIRDPDNHVIMQRTRDTNRGCVSDQLQLLQHATKGIYQITVEGENTHESAEVEVDAYKLPKFEATILAPDKLYTDSRGVTIKIIAKYTYGMPVKGKAIIVIRGRRHRISKTFQNFTGEAEIALNEEDVASFKASHPPYRRYGRRYRRRSEIVVNVNVIEKHTEISSKKIAIIKVVERRSKVKLVRSQKIWMSGMDYTADLKVVEEDGTPLAEWIRTETSISIEATLQIKRETCYPGVRRRCSKQIEPSVPHFTETYIYDDIPLDGAVTLHINSTQLADIHFNRFKFKVYLNGYRTGIYWDVDVLPSLQIHTDDNTAHVGNVSTFNIQTTNLTKSIQITVMNEGRNVHMENINAEEETTLFNYQLLVTDEMYPSIKLLASYIQNGQIVAHFIHLPVAFHLPNKVEISTSENSLKAGENINIRIQSSSPSNLVAIKAIDKSVGILKTNTNNDVTMEKVKKEQERHLAIEEYDSNNRRYFHYRYFYNEPSPSEEAFDKADLILLSDAGFPDNKVYKKRGPQYSSTTPWITTPTPWWITTLPFTTTTAIPMFATTTTRPRTTTTRPRTTTTANPYYLTRRKFSRLTTTTSRMITTRRRGNSTPKKRTRKFFPETWLWKEIFTNENGTYELNAKVPDSVTSWKIDAFAISNTLGLGLAETTEISVFQNFFINFNLPVKMIRGEIIIIQAVVFNYLPEDIEVTLELHHSTNFQLIIPGDDVTIAGAIRRFTVPGRDSFSVWYPVRMTSLGNVEVRATANGGFVFDSLTRTVRVDPEGLRLCFTDSKLLTRLDAEDPTSEVQLRIDVPEDQVVEGSLISTFHIYGEMMGSTMDNLGDLLQVPTGCGEQNMLSFAPDVFITLYLEQTDRLTTVLKNTAYKHFLTGYQNQLRYKHNDGSYSAFGDKDRHGSLWLTAFVLKCFQHATNMEEGISSQLHQVINQARRFIFTQKTPYGYFYEAGVIYHTALQGGVNSKVTMTAYTLISLLEGRDLDEVRSEVEENKVYLEENLDSIKNKTYDLAIVTYALHLLNSDRADEALLDLESRAIVENECKYWHEDEELESNFKQGWSRFHRPLPSSDIEMTSYALLIYALRRDFNSIQSVTRWLISKRNHLGAYDNTQNTVLAIQALTSAVSILQSEQNLDINFTSISEQQMMNLNEENFMIYNRFDLQASDHEVDIQANGSGVGVVQLSICYNIIPPSQHSQISSSQHSPFECSYIKNSNISNDDMNIAQLTLTCSLKEEVNVTVGMLLYQVNIPNGFKIDPENVQRRNRNSKKVEFEKGSANFYFDGLPHGEEVQVDITMERNEKIAASKPSTITISDYYQPGRSLVLSYSFENLEQSDACSVCGGNCAGCTTYST